MDALLTLRDAAAILVVHPDTLKTYARLGRIGCVRLGLGKQGLRFRESDLAAFIAAHSTQPQAADMAATEPYDIGRGRTNRRAKSKRTA